MISEFVEYVKQAWKNKPNVSSPLNADRMNHMEAGIENNSKKIKETVTAVNELTEKKAEIVQKVYTNITSDQYGFFSIAKLTTDFPNGFKIISAYGKDGGISSEGSSVLPVFSIDKTNKTKNYGYVYKASGAAMIPVGNATNMTFLITFLIG